MSAGTVDRGSHGPIGSHRHQAAPAQRRSARGVRRGVVLTVAVALCAAGLAGVRATGVLDGAVRAQSAATAPGLRGVPAGSADVGSTAHDVPPGAVVVAPDGDDGAAGTPAAPLRTVGRAVALAADGGTVVLRGGTYHESVTLPAGRRLTLQPHPGEAVWFDGTAAVAEWRADGATWVRAGWTTEFDSTPCYKAGSCDTTDESFRFVGDDAPMAAHPDQVWVDGTALTQVAAASDVVPGTFHVDDEADVLRIGTDPTGREVRASDLAEAITVRSAGSVVRGVGVRGYATPLPKMATVKLDAPDVTLEDVVVRDNATTGVIAAQPGITLRRVTAERNGTLGILANYADGLVVAAVAALDNNRERFKPSPVAGGIKITRSRAVVVEGSALRDNAGTGLWFDESVHGMTVTGNDVTGNDRHGISLELSAQALVADNLVARNGGDGLKVNNTESVQVWNNTFAGGGRAVWLVQDRRSAADLSTPGHDPRQQLPDPTVTWLTGRVTLSNNVFSMPAGDAPCVLCVEDTTGARSAEDMRVATDGNLYNRSGPTSPFRLVLWSTAGGAPRVFVSLSGFAAATDQERASLAVDGPPFVAEDGTVLGTTAATGDVPLALPDDVAAATGRTAGERHLGAWRG